MIRFKLPLKRSALMMHSCGDIPKCLLCLCSNLQKPTTSLDSQPGPLAINPLIRGNHYQRKQKRRSQSSQKWMERQQKDPYVQKAQEQDLPSRASFKLQQINEVHFATLQMKIKNKGKRYSNKQKEKTRLIQPDMLILDLGAAPGGWSLYASTQLKHDLGAVVAVDLLPLDETLHSKNTGISSRIASNLQRDFQFIQGDFTDHQTQLKIMDACSRMPSLTVAKNDRRPDLILSDMAANFTGDQQTDALQTLNLCEQALAFAAGGSCFDPYFSARDEQGMLAGGGAFLCKYFTCGRQNEADLMEAAKRTFRTVHKIKPAASRKESSEMYMLALGYKCK